jgi:hypothetical protein
MVRLLFPAIALILTLSHANSAHAVLKFHYDPLTGNVSFDTADTRTGGILQYILSLPLKDSPLQFRTENHVQITNSTLRETKPLRLAETTLAGYLTGLYTIGDVLPVGLSEETWTSIFAAYGTSSNGHGAHKYVDLLGGGHPEPAEFIYGKPDRSFDNWFDLIDPDDLAWAKQARLIYDPSTGNVSIDTSGGNGGYSTAFLLKSSNAFAADRFAPTFARGPLTQATSGVIAAFFDLLEPGEYELGPVLSPNMTASEFRSTFTKAVFHGRAGFRSINFDFENGERLRLVYIPEPSCVAILCSAFGAIGMLRGRFPQRWRSMRASH